jgi:CubicO group peptidase (beta-lactamase class C family)
MATAMAGFDDLVEEAMAEWKVPGLVIAVVQDGEINN